MADPIKSYDLVWLIHLVGDVHQPLHCVTRITATNPKGDMGGNLVLVSGPSKELHAFWDQLLGLGETKNFMTAAKVAGSLPEPDAALVGKDKEDDWTAESYALAGTAVYISPVLAGLGPYTISPAYTANAQQIAKQRVALAGARLAHLITTALQCDDKACAH